MVWTIFVNLESEGAKKSEYWENHLMTQIPDLQILSKPYINGNMIYSAFRWCINLNLNRMTGFVLQGHMLIFTRAASLHYINTCHNCVLNIECILPDLFTCCKYKHIYNKWQNTLVYKIQSIKVFIISYKVLLFKQVNHLNESCIV